MSVSPKAGARRGLLVAVVSNLISSFYKQCLLLWDSWAVSQQVVAATLSLCWDPGAATSCLINEGRDVNERGGQEGVPLCEAHC